MAIKDLDEKKISEVEATVKEELDTLLSEQNVFEYVDRIHIFELHQKQVHRFHFLSGHRGMMKKLAVEVNKHSLSHYEMSKDFEVLKKDVVRCPLGFLYGHKTYACESSAKMNSDYSTFCDLHTDKSKFEAKPIDTASNQLVSQMCEVGLELVERNVSARDLINSGQTTNDAKTAVSGIESNVVTLPTELFNGEESNAYENSTELCSEDSKTILTKRINTILEHFQLNVSKDRLSFTKKGTKVAAHIPCVVCQKESKDQDICAQYEMRKNKGFWNLSNFVKHLKRMHTDNEGCDLQRKKPKLEKEPTVKAICSTSCS